MDEVILNKFSGLEKCINRVREEYTACNGDIKNDILRQDSIILNIERACEQCIDIGQRIIRKKKLGLAKEYRDVFTILSEQKVISETMADHLKKMVGFRNLAIHEYTAIDIDILKAIIENRLEELLEFGRIIIKQ